MKYQIKSDNIELSSSMEALTKEKFERVERRLTDIDEGSKWIKVVLNSAPDQMFEVKATVHADRDDYFSDETDYTLETALVKTVEEIIHMMEKDKDQRRKDHESLRDELQGEVAL